jgi:flagellin
MKSMTDLCKGKSGSDDVTLAQLDISTQEGANKALDAVKGMISNVDSYRGTLGAKINRLGHAIENQNNVISNTEDSRMRIRDADSAEETANLTAYQIRQQAAVAMLSQANSSQSIVLSLLGG